MPQESIPRLINFVYEAFGEQCAALLMVGFGEEPTRAVKKVYVWEAEGSDGRRWEIKIISDSPPRRSEPLVLASVLRILLRNKSIPSPLEFQMSEVLSELLRDGVSFTQEDVNRTISKYVSLFYDKRAEGGDESDEAGGVYSLVTAYLRGSASKAGGISPALLSSSVQFDQNFIAGLRRGEVVLAGIRFGSLRRPPE